MNNGDIKNFRLRRMLKQGMFEEARKKKCKRYSSTLKLLKVESVVSWVNRVMEKMRQKRSLIIKSFKICRLSTKLDGSEKSLVHNFEYLNKRIVQKKLRFLLLFVSQISKLINFLNIYYYQKNFENISLKLF